MAHAQANLTVQSNIKSAPKFSFTSATPAKAARKNVPGPGEYGMGVDAGVDKFKRSASWTLGGTGRSGKSPHDTPGPGSYQPTLQKDTKNVFFTQDSRLKANKKSNTPGPGQYFSMTSPDGRQFSICSRPDMGGRLGDIPGPGQYKPSFESLSGFSSMPKVSFGASSRSDSFVAKGPGPGSYDHEMFKNGWKNSPKYSVAGRYNREKTERTPGPGGLATQFK